MKKINDTHLEKLRPGSLAIKKNPQVYWDAVPIVDGLPVFSGSLETQWTIIRSWEGNITINDIVLKTKFTYTKWYTTEIDKRLLKDGVPLVLTKLWKEYCKAYEDEQELRRNKFDKTKKKQNKEYYEENRDRLDIVRVENRAIERLKTEERTNEVFKLLIEGKQKHEVISMIAKRDGIPEKKILLTIANAYRKMADMAIEERKTLRDKHIAQLQYLYQKNLENGDLREARAVLMDINKMEGLNEPEKKQLEVKQQIIRFNFDNPITDDEVNKIKASNYPGAMDIDYTELNTNKPPSDEDILLNEEE